MAAHPAAPRDWFVCPVCGVEVPAGAPACPECGSDDRTGWSPETEYDGVDIPETDVKPVEDAAWRDPASEALRAGLPPWIVVTAVLLIVLLLWLALSELF